MRRRRIHELLSFSLAVVTFCLPAQVARAQAELAGTYVDYLGVGANGIMINSADHSMRYRELEGGIVSGDVWYPGTPIHEIIVEATGTANFKARNGWTTTQIATTIPTGADGRSISWKGRYSSGSNTVDLKLTYGLEASSRYVSVSLELTNSGAVPLHDVYLCMNGNPDMGYALNSSYYTFNDVRRQPPGDNSALVTSGVSAPSPFFLGLGSWDTRARVHVGGTSPDPSTTWAAPYDPNGTFSNSSQAIVFRQADLAIGETVTFYLVYVWGPDVTTVEERFDAATIGSPYIASTRADDAVHGLSNDLSDLFSFAAGAADPDGVATDGELIYTGHAATQEVVAYNFSGEEQLRWTGPMSGLSGLEVVNGRLLVGRGATVDLFVPATGAPLGTLPAPCAASDIAFDGALLHLLCATEIVSVNLSDGAVTATIPNPAVACGGSALAVKDGVLVVFCSNGDWFRVAAKTGAVLSTGNSGGGDLDYSGLDSCGADTLFFSQDNNANGLFAIDRKTGHATAIGDGLSGVTAQNVGLASSAAAGVLFGTTWSDIVMISSDGDFARVLPGSVGAEGLAYCDNYGVLYGALNGVLFSIDVNSGMQLATLPSPGADIEGLACDTATDRVFGVGDDTRLFAYSPAAGSWTVVGDTGVNWNSAGLAWDPTSGVLYAIGEGGGGNLYTIQSDSAVASLVGPLGIQAKGEGFVGGGLTIAPTCYRCSGSPIFVDGFESGDTTAWDDPSDPESSGPSDP